MKSKVFVSLLLININTFCPWGYPVGSKMGRKSTTRVNRPGVNELRRRQREADKRRLNGSGKDDCRGLAKAAAVVGGLSLAAMWLVYTTQNMQKD